MSNAVKLQLRIPNDVELDTSITKIKEPIVLMEAGASPTLDCAPDAKTNATKRSLSSEINRVNQELGSLRSEIKEADKNLRLVRAKFDNDPKDEEKDELRTKLCEDSSEMNEIVIKNKANENLHNKKHGRDNTGNNTTFEKQKSVNKTEKDVKNDNKGGNMGVNDKNIRKQAKSYKLVNDGKESTAREVTTEEELETDHKGKKDVTRNKAGMVYWMTAAILLGIVVVSCFFLLHSTPVEIYAPAATEVDNAVKQQFKTESQYDLSDDKNKHVDNEDTNTIELQNYVKVQNGKIVERVNRENINVENINGETIDITKPERDIGSDTDHKQDNNKLQRTNLPYSPGVNANKRHDYEKEIKPNGERSQQQDEVNSISDSIRNTGHENAERKEDEQMRTETVCDKEQSNIDDSKINAGKEKHTNVKIIPKNEEINNGNFDQLEVNENEVDEKEVNEKEVNEKEVNEKEVNEKEVNEKEVNEKEVNEKEVNEREVNEKEVNEKEVNEKEVNENEVNENEINEKEVDDKEVNEKEVNEKEVNEKGLDYDTPVSESIKITEVTAESSQHTKKEHFAFVSEENLPPMNENSFNDNNVVSDGELMEHQIVAQSRLDKSEEDVDFVKIIEAREARYAQLLSIKERRTANIKEVFMKQIEREYWKDKARKLAVRIRLEEKGIIPKIKTIAESNLHEIGVSCLIGEDGQTCVAKSRVELSEVDVKDIEQNIVHEKKKFTKSLYDPNKIPRGRQVVENNGDNVKGASKKEIQKRRKIIKEIQREKSKNIRGFKRQKEKDDRGRKQFEKERKKHTKALKRAMKFPNIQKKIKEKISIRNTFKIPEERRITSGMPPAKMPAPVRHALKIPPRMKLEPSSAYQYVLRNLRVPPNPLPVIDSPPLKELSLEEKLKIQIEEQQAKHVLDKMKVRKKSEKLNVVREKLKLERVKMQDTDREYNKEMKKLLQEEQKLERETTKLQERVIKRQKRAEEKNKRDLIEARQAERRMYVLEQEIIASQPNHTVTNIAIRDKLKHPYSNDGVMTQKKREPYLHMVAEISEVIDASDKALEFKIDDIDAYLHKRQFSTAFAIYQLFLIKYPQEERLWLGRALAINHLAEKNLTEPALLEGANAYSALLYQPCVTEPTFNHALELSFSRFKIVRRYDRMYKMMNMLQKQYPNRLIVMKKWIMALMYVRQVARAKSVIAEQLIKRPTDGFLLVHMAHILYKYEWKYSQSIPFWKKGIETLEPQTLDKRFYVNYGDALQRTGKRGLAYQVYNLGEQKNLFLSAVQRSFHNVITLSGHPWWPIENTGQESTLKVLAPAWEIMRDEVLEVIARNSTDPAFMPEPGDWVRGGQWTSLMLYSKGQRHADNCARVPKTCRLLGQFSAATSCHRCQIKFTLLSAGAHVLPHVGATNCNIRNELGLIASSNARIRVHNETRLLEEGKWISYDDSFENEILNRGPIDWLSLCIDTWHPELKDDEKESLYPV